MTAVALQYRDQIIEQVATGVMLDKVADGLGIAAPNISKYLASDPEYKQAREIGTELRLHRSRSAVAEIASLGVNDEGTIVGISKAVSNLARVREQRLRADQWFAEREFPERWGGKPTIVINQGISMDQALDAAAAKLLDRMRVVSGEVVDKSEDK